MATKKTTEKATEANEVEVVNPMDDRVEITLIPPNADLEGATKYISINGYTATAKYGEPMVVPRFVKAALENEKMARIEVKKRLEKATLKK